MSFLGTALGQCGSSLAALQPRPARPAAPRSLVVRSVVAEAEPADTEVPAAKVRALAAGAVAAIGGCAGGGAAAAARCPPRHLQEIPAARLGMPHTPCSAHEAHSYCMRRPCTLPTAACLLPQRLAAPHPAPQPPPTLELLKPPKRTPPIWRVPPSARTRASKEKYFSEQAALRAEAKQARQDAWQARQQENGGGGGGLQLASKPDRTGRFISAGSGPSPVGSRFGSGGGGGGAAAGSSGGGGGNGGRFGDRGSDRGGGRGGRGGGGKWSDPREKKQNQKINIEGRRKARQSRREERAEEREANKVGMGAERRACLSARWCAYVSSHESGRAASMSSRVAAGQGMSLAIQSAAACCRLPAAHAA